MLGRNKYLLFNHNDVAECNEICNNFINVVDALRIPMTTSSKVENNNECFSLFYNTAYRKGFVKISKSVNKTWEMTKHELSSLLFSALTSIVESEKKNFITDPFVEKLWDEMEYTPFSKFCINENGETVLNESWNGWEEGTPRTVIDIWFDTHHSKGLGYLMDMGVVDSSDSKEKQTDCSQEIKAGQVVSFDVEDTGYYDILVQEVDGTKIKGVVTCFSSCYSEACYPESIIPTVCIEEHDLANEYVCNDSIRIREATRDEDCYVSNAEKAQKDFLRSMVPLTDGHTYQELTFEIATVNKKSDTKDNGTYCNTRMVNIVGFDKDGQYKNPYVVDRKFYTDTLEGMEKAYNTYGSAKGIVVPETKVSFKFLSITDNRYDEMFSISVPYAVVMEKGMDIFPMEMSEECKEKANNALVFMSRHTEV